MSGNKTKRLEEKTSQVPIDIEYHIRPGKNNSEHHKRGKDMKKYDIKYSFILLVWLRF